ncbi:uncharacterized protein OCT59_002015 [Rhizophagus irregularis]|uniref:uncharacterized protein n=1 Tax=Rhizophagus irregularis TaxID=588596 RepID=UPI00332A6350|nr:hypothetical protein OCT59_002015 [Rhizophagus irregularis]
MRLVTRSSKNYNKTITYSNSIICLVISWVSITSLGWILELENMGMTAGYELFFGETSYIRLILAKIFYLSCLKIFVISENNNNHRKLNTVNKRPCHQQLTYVNQ